MRIRRFRVRPSVLLVLLVPPLWTAAPSARADVAWSCVWDDVGDGLVRYVVRFRSDDLPIAGFALRFEAPGLHNIEPHGLHTVFQDNNRAFGSVGAPVSRDTQFLFRRSGRERRIYVAPNDLTREGPGFLSGDFELRDKTRQERDAAQLVAPRGEVVRFGGWVGVDDGRSGSQRRKYPVEGRIGAAGSGPAEEVPARACSPREQAP